MTLRNILSTLVLLALSQQLLTQPAHAHGGEDHSHDPAPLAQATGEQPRRLSDGSLYIPKSAQHLWQLRTSLVKAAQLPQQIELQYLPKGIYILSFNGQFVKFVLNYRKFSV